LLLTALGDAIRRSSFRKPTNVGGLRRPTSQRQLYFHFAAVEIRESARPRFAFIFCVFVEASLL
jgi:hypothetical protein